MKTRELLRRLVALGVVVEPARGKGGHYLLRYGGNKAPLPVHGDQDVGNIFIKRLCKQLGVKHEEL
ncbi:MAG: type II toxin-antitoxin system HicA family toxin [Pseudodesulfovibrio sp.]|uniref:type II toxin-antitoxin system HicA family toxin n=1 Tax=Pseudodesulfovibrio sp. TaxID=2035812 RepID=UPI003D0D273E